MRYAVTVFLVQILTGIVLSASLEDKLTAITGLTEEILDVLDDPAKQKDQEDTTSGKVDNSSTDDLPSQHDAGQGDPAIWYGDHIHIVNLYGPGGFLDTCGHGGCDGGYGVSTATSANRDALSGTWVIEGMGTGCVRYGDHIHIKNAFNVGTYLDTCHHSGNGYGVFTAKRAKRDANSGTWVIEGKGKGCVKANSDEIHIKNLFDQGTYLDTNGWGGCLGGFSVSTTTNKNRDGKSGTWKILKDLKNPYCGLPQYRGVDSDTRESEQFGFVIVSRLFFNTITGKCETFEYNDRGGNKNNFETMTACAEACVQSDA